MTGMFFKIGCFNRKLPVIMLAGTILLTAGCTGHTGSNSRSQFPVTNSTDPGVSLSQETWSQSESDSLASETGSHNQSGSGLQDKSLYGTSVISGGKTTVRSSSPVSPIPTVTYSGRLVRDCEQGHISANDSGYQIPDLAVPKLLTAEQGWVRSEKNILTGFFSMYQPEVVYVPGEEYPYKMWFMGWAYNTNNEREVLAGGTIYPGFPGGDAIFMARSRDMDNWEVYSKTNCGTGTVYWDKNRQIKDWTPVLTCQDVWYDDFHVGDPSVVYQDGKYYMAYSAMGNDKPNPRYSYAWQDAAYCIMGAASTDGINWTRTKAPLLIWEKEYGMDEDISRSPKNDTYFGMYQRPSLMYDGGKWKIWYDYWAGYNSGNGTSIGYAENSGNFMDPKSWNRKTGDTTPLIKQFVDIDVVKIGRIYYAYGDPYLQACGISDPEIKVESPEWSLRQIVETQSEDGLKWKITGYFRPDAGSPTNQIPQVFLDHKNQRVCIFYATQRGLQGSSSYDWHWNNFRYMYKSLTNK